MKKYPQIFLFVLFFIAACSQSKSGNDSLDSRMNDTSDEFIDWYVESTSDTLANVSIQKANLYVDSLNSSTDIIVAIIDGVVDINHEDLKNSIYVNKNEIPDNGIDDDANGFIDDIKGWNFLGKKNGGYIDYAPYDYLRVLKHLIEKYDAANLDTLKITNREDRILFKRLVYQRKGVIDYGQTLLDWAENHRNNYFEAFEKYQFLFIGKEYSLKDLDSIKPETKKDSNILATLKYFKKYDITIDRINQFEKDAYARKFLINNLDFNPFHQIDSFPEDLNYQNYGNPFVGSYPERYAHGTQVAGILAAQRGNRIGIQGVSNNIKLMVLEVTPTFNERTKDFINAVKYAVDNGAKIINYSGSKYQFTQMEAFDNIIEYAKENNVLFVTSSGNRGLNTDLKENTCYPTGVSKDGLRMNNFLSVGATNRYKNKNLLSKSSNYGKKSVDIFAPGVDMKTTDVYENRYMTLGGTSLSAALTSGVAALIWSAFPNLDASEVRDAILKSGTKYDIEVQLKDGTLIHFSELSRSGSVINAYNALKLAEAISNKK